LNVRNYAEVAEFFLRDLFAFLVPGCVLFVSLELVLGRALDDTLGDFVVLPPENLSQWTIAIISTYILGACLQGVGENLVERAINFFGQDNSNSNLWKLGRFSHLWKLPNPSNIEPRANLEARITRGPAFSAARVQLSQRLRFDVSSDLHDVRNLAMSIAPDKISEVYRNMYTSQLCLGSAVALLVASGVTVVGYTLDQFTSVNLELRSNAIAWLAAFLPMSLLLLDRRFRYYGISMRIPLPIALAHMSSAPVNQEKPVPMKGHSVYLAGGMRTGWQDHVRAGCPQLTFFDPRDHALTDPRDYAAWDLNHVRECDLVFAYIAKDNPSGLGLALELGFAKALGKTTVLVDERSSQDPIFARYFAIVSAAADVTKPTLKDGIAFLKSFAP
jgi:hypothetical protein